MSQEMENEHEPNKKRNTNKAGQRKGTSITNKTDEQRKRNLKRKVTRTTNSESGKTNRKGKTKDEETNPDKK
jgi:hypothetical protein